MNNPIRPSAHDEWVTVSVVPAPGKLRNYYGENKIEAHNPCYAFLLQELRATDHSWSETRPDGTITTRYETDSHEAPYETRVVAAALTDGELTPACDTDNFIGTAPPVPVPLTPNPTYRLSDIDWLKGVNGL